jgi:hypothetical protein
MKHLLFIALLACICGTAGAQNTRKMETQQTDSTMIAHALEAYYFKGIYEGNADTLGKIFHESTLLFGDKKGEPYTNTLAGYLNAVATRQSPKNSGKPFKSEIISIKVINSIAVAEVNVKMYDYNYYDFLSFHKFNGTWLIVSKLLTDVQQ